jgi:peroxiredoxin
MDGREVLMNFRGFLSLLTIAFVSAFLWFLSSPHKHPLAESKRSDLGKVGFRVGERAPEFELRSTNGEKLKLSDLRGKPVLLNFWATWCAPCRVEMPWLVQLDHAYRPQGLQIVGVAMDDSGETQDVAAFAEQRGVKYQVVLGNSTVANEYGGVRFMPQSFFIDQNGKIAKTTTGLTDEKDLEDGVKSLLQGNSQIAQGDRP